MEPKTELLVFNRKEISVIVVLLVLVALFSFTLGLRLGKSVATAEANRPEAVHSDEHAPLSAEHVVADPKHAVSAVSHEEKHSAEAVSEKSEAEEVVAKPKVVPGAADRADSELATELKQEKVAVAKPIPMSLPVEKSAVLTESGKYTLQVGSHRTVAEAAEQVTSLKRSGLDAFYLEANVPGKGTWYRVGVGLFTDKEKAEKTALQWKATKALPPYIVQKTGE